MAFDFQFIIEANNGITPVHLQQLRVNTLTNDECRRRLENLIHQNIYEGTLCAVAGHSQGACIGDFGGPLAVNGQLVGIASWTWPHQCGTARPDGYVRVSTYLNWIQEVSDVVAV